MSGNKNNATTGGFIGLLGKAAGALAGPSAANTVNEAGQAVKNRIVDWLAGPPNASEQEKRLQAENQRLLREKAEREQKDHDLRVQQQKQREAEAAVEREKLRKIQLENERKERELAERNNDKRNQRLGRVTQIYDRSKNIDSREIENTVVQEGVRIKPLLLSEIGKRLNHYGHFSNAIDHIQSMGVSDKTRNSSLVLNPENLTDIVLNMEIPNNSNKTVNEIIDSIIDEQKVPLGNQSEMREHLEALAIYAYKFGFETGYLPSMDSCTVSKMALR